MNLEYRAGGVHARKTFDFDQEKYQVGHLNGARTKRKQVFRIEIVLQGEFRRPIASGRCGKDDMRCYQTAGAVHRIACRGDRGATGSDGTLAGVEDQYFLAMFIRDKEGPSKFSKQDYKLPDLADGTVAPAALGLSVAVPSTQPMTLLCGPKAGVEPGSQGGSQAAGQCRILAGGSSQSLQNHCW